jgi:ubiquitin C-terminal hydrolase
MLHQSSTTICPRDFLGALYEKVPFLQHGEQHDICEVWMLLCEAIAQECGIKEHLKKYNMSPQLVSSWKHKNIAYARMLISASLSFQRHNKNNACEWLDTFQGSIVTQVYCKKCGEIYHNFEPFTLLTLEIPRETQNVTLVDCIQHLFKTEELDEWKCDKCHSRASAEKLVRFWNIPKVLCLSIKRFVHTANTIHKNTTPIDIPLNITFSQDSAFGPDYFDKPDAFFTYKLRSVGLHHGSLHGGHYNSIVLEDGAALLVDDETTVPLSQDAFSQHIRDAYFVVYELH